MSSGRQKSRKSKRTTGGASQDVWEPLSHDNQSLWDVLSQRIDNWEQMVVWNFGKMGLEQDGWGLTRCNGSHLKGTCQNGIDMKVWWIHGKDVNDGTHGLLIGFSWFLAGRCKTLLLSFAAITIGSISQPLD